MTKGSFDILMLLDNPLTSDQRVEKEAASLTEAGLTVGILASNEDQSLPEKEEGNGYTILRRISPFFKHPMRSGYKDKVSELAAEVLRFNFAILHCHDFQLLPVAAEVKAKRPETFFLYDSHEFLLGWPYYKETPGLFNRIKGYFVWKRFLRLERVHTQAMNAFICPSPAIGVLQRKQLQTSLSPLILRNIPSEPEEVKDFNLRAALDLPKDAILIVHAGNLHQSDKEIDRLVASVGSQPGRHLLFVGNRPRFFAVKERLEAHPEWNAFVHFFEYDAKTLFHVLKQCDIGVAATQTKYLAHRVGSSNRVMEYTKAGIPVIATNQESHAAMQASFGHLELYNPTDSDSIELALDTILNDLPAYSKKAISAAGSLSWEHEIRPLVNLYLKISEQYLIQNNSK
ncbi:MAG: glycosyltransferase [Flavobacteriales bacterium]|nr:glycosyltransferase [Flavobacteriales bacterium]